MGNLFQKLHDFFATKEMEIVIVGLEKAGKSTLTSKITNEEQFMKGPTLGLDIRTVKKNNVTMKLWDLGGQGHVISPIPNRMGKIRNWLQCYNIRG